MLSLLFTIGYSIGSFADLKETVTMEEAKSLYSRELNWDCFEGYTSWRRPFVHKHQCFERAQVWSFGVEQHFNVKTYKAFMFYSKKYRSKDYCKGGSKFHVTPLVKVKNSETGKVNYKTLDHLGHKPRDLHSWSRIFIKEKNGCSIPSNYRCPIITLEEYEGYENSKYQYTDFCYIVITPGYMFYESDLENRKYQTDWDYIDVKRAFERVKNKCLKQSRYSYYRDLLY